MKIRIRFSGTSKMSVLWVLDQLLSQGEFVSRTNWWLPATRRAGELASSLRFHCGKDGLRATADTVDVEVSPERWASLIAVEMTTGTQLFAKRGEYHYTLEVVDAEEASL